MPNNQNSRWGDIVSPSVEKSWLDRWDFGGFFISCLLEVYFSEAASKLTGFLEEYVLGARDGNWDEERRVAHIMSINDRCHLDKDGIAPYQMEAAFRWFEKMASGDPDEWTKLIARIVVYNPNYRSEYNPFSRLLQLSPLPDDIFVLRYWVSVGNAGKYEDPEVGSVMCEGGHPIWALLREKGLRPGPKGHRYLLLVPRTVRDQIQVIELDPLGVGRPSS